MGRIHISNNLGKLGTVKRYKPPRKIPSISHFKPPRSGFKQKDDKHIISRPKCP